MIETEYLNLLNAIRDYYGGDTVLEVYTNQVSPSEFASLLEGLPNCDVVLNADGTVRSYHVNTTVDVGAVPLSEYLAEINSNTQTSDKVNVSIPMNTTVDSQSGNVLVEAGAKTAAGGAIATATVAKPKNWLVPLVAVGTLITLGKLTMPELYQDHPEFFGEGSLAQLDQEMWDEVTQERKSSEPAPISNATRFIDGFINVERDSQTNKDSAVAYADAQAMAYIIKYCLENGVFSTGDNEVHGEISNISITQPLYYVSEIHVEYDDGRDHYVERVVPENPDTRLFVYYSNSRYAWSASCLTSGRVLHYTKRNNDAEYVKNTITLSAKTNLSRNYYDSSGGIIFGYNTSSNFSFNVPLSVDQSNFTTVSPPNAPTRIAFAGLFGTVSTESPIDGINQESGATTPSFNPDDTYAQILEKIATDLPDLWDKRISQNVVQPDGTTKEYIYLPISLPIPNPNPTDGKEPEDQPIAGNQGQEDTKIDPETSPEIILQITYDDTVSPRTPTEETTGTGSTPPVVIPTGSASALYSIYNPSNTEINSFGAWLWSSNFVDQLLKVFNDPMQAIISLHKVFCSPSVSGRDDIKVGYLNSGVESNIVDEQYVTVPCGSVNLREDYNNVFDYPPHTDVSLYLPFIGIVKLDTNDVMRSTISITYHIDVLTGACLAEVSVTRDMFGGVLYQYAGDCSVRYPLSSGSYMGVVSALVGVAGTVASGGALAPMALGVAGGMMGARSSIERSGGFSGNAGAMGSKKPYLIIQRPQINTATDFEKFEGKPSNETVKISECTGFISCTEVHALNTICTESEMSELISLLKSGILI